MQKTSTIPFKYCVTWALVSIISLWFSWQVYPVFLLIGFAPVLLIEARLDELKRGGRIFWLFCLGITLGWNLLTTWWLGISTIAGAIAANVLNALLMTLPFVCYRITRKALNNNYGYLTFVLYWLSFEYLHLHWDLAWAWLTLGNAFASTTYLVQWYEYTGVLGGSLWVLLLNLLVYFVIKSKLLHNRRLYAFYTGILILVPTVVSLLIQARYEAKGRAIEVVIVQPNIDPYTQKFRGGSQFIPYSQQVQRFVNQAQTQLSSQTQLLIFPETAFDEQYIEPQLKQHKVMQQLDQLLARYPRLSLITGATTARFYGRLKATPTARLHPKINKYYDIFNTAIHLQHGQPPAFYHKSKLVSGVETIPYPEVFSALGGLLIDLGGTSGSYGTQTERSTFKVNDSVYTAPLVCFESIHGDFVREFVSNGAHMLTVITNDGWWGDTEGHRKHFTYTRLRAIETRRSIAFCANTGTSGCIDQLGRVQVKTAYNQAKMLRHTLQANDQRTVYTQYGDYIGRLAAFVAVGLLLTLFVKRITKGKTGTLKKDN